MLLVDVFRVVRMSVRVPVTRRVPYVASNGWPLVTIFTWMPSSRPRYDIVSDAQERADTSCGPMAQLS